MAPARIIIGISGASGALYGVNALRLARASGVETHLVVSRAALLTLHQEMGIQKSDLTSMADIVHSASDVGASIASGSFKTMGMLIAPCSVKTLSEIASGVTSTLMSRAADVILKERRRLVLMLRETPLHLGHLKSMTAVTEMGAIVMPPVPAFYSHPASIDEMVNHSVGRALDLFDIETGVVKRWQGLKAQTDQ
ncbi:MULTISPECIES: UbiX family flavin prenyltransferase [Brucella/Ochrobactrum group]|uniref:UbiX family flavin prenyltransferase n=1 Tax=Brucella/Ochrobactrum group TaxID=2826938 RepID=UPI001C057128|nr:UbiX family flavin prenyltransferase [Brucella sp. NBRC 12950]QWK81101.1 UbiX family flavin prenyltransferase [Ochrobactrum sp. BTU1]GLU27551.1 flavin prenyltransferase UbiX [Brucella sp. NBRC 12950]